MIISLSYKCRKLNNFTDSRAPEFELLTCSDFNKINRVAKNYNLTDPTCIQSLSLEQMKSLNGQWGVMSEQYNDELDKIELNSTYVSWKSNANVGTCFISVITYITLF